MKKLQNSISGAQFSCLFLTGVNLNVNLSQPANDKWAKVSEFVVIVVVVNVVAVVVVVVVVVLSFLKTKQSHAKLRQHTLFARPAFLARRPKAGSRPRTSNDNDNEQHYNHIRD